MSVEVLPILRRQRYLEDQDFWRLSGIFRNVYLWSAADLHLRDFFFHAELDDACCDAKVTIDFEVMNYADQPRKCSVETSILTLDGKPVAEFAPAKFTVPANVTTQHTPAPASSRIRPSGPPKRPTSTNSSSP